MTEPRPILREVEELFAARRWAELEARVGALAPREVESEPALAFALAAAEFHRGALKEAEGHARAAEDGFARRGDWRNHLRALNWLAAVRFELGDLAGAEEGFARVLEEAPGLGAGSLGADAANNLGAVWSLRGLPEQALGFYRLCLPFYRKLGDALNVARAHHNIAIAYRDAGRLDRAAAYFEKAEERARQVGDRRLLAMALAGRADLAQRRGDGAVAGRLAERALEEADRARDPLARCDALRVLGAVAAARGRWKRAAAHLDEAHEIARVHGQRLLEAEVLRERGALRLRRRSPEGARADLEAAAALFREIGAVGEEERTRRLLSG